MTRPGIEPWSPGPLANTLTIIPMSGSKGRPKILYSKSILQLIKANPVNKHSENIKQT